LTRSGDVGAGLVVHAKRDARVIAKIVFGQVAVQVLLGAMLIDGVWDAALVALNQQVRLASGRQAEPSAAIIDSQSVKTTEKRGSAGTTLGRK